MKVVVSYLSSFYDKKKTIDLINDTSADGLHVDLIDGIYVGKKNFEREEFNDFFKDNNKPLDVHLMVQNPSSYLHDIFMLYPDCIYVHPDSDSGIIGIMGLILEQGIKRGIVINPDQELKDFAHYFSYVDRVLLMSVNPGYGGQEFIIKTQQKLDELIALRGDNNFEIFVDGGINDDTIKLVKNADGVVSGSFVCKSNDFQKQIDLLKKNAMS